MDIVSEIDEDAEIVEGLIRVDRLNELSGDLEVHLHSDDTDFKSSLKTGMSRKGKIVRIKNGTVKINMSGYVEVRSQNEEACMLPRECVASVRDESFIWIMSGNVSNVERPFNPTRERFHL